MEFDANVAALQTAYWTILAVAGPVLAAALVVGLVVGVVQAATSVNEQTLSFVPKLLVAMGMMALASGFMLGRMTAYFGEIFASIAALR